MSIELNALSLSHYSVAKVFSGSVVEKRDSIPVVNSIDFHRKGEMMASSDNNGVLSLYDVNVGEIRQTVFSKDFGCHGLKYTHNDLAVLYAAVMDSGVRYMSFHDNVIMHNFEGHTRRVTSINMSPIDDSFLTCSEDQTFRLWDLRSKSCSGYGEIRESGKIGASYDNTGLVFAVGLPNGFINLYDARKYVQGPFATSPFALPGGAESLLFSPDGASILISGHSKSTVILDSRTYKEEARFTEYKNENVNKQLGVTFSPDSKYVASASEDGPIIVWEAKTGRPVTKWKGHATHVSALKWHPFSELVASGSLNTCLWLQSDPTERGK